MFKMGDVCRKVTQRLSEAMELTTAEGLGTL